jgi:hypothetical protein
MPWISIMQGGKAGIRYYVQCRPPRSLA